MKFECQKCHRLFEKDEIIATAEGYICAACFEESANHIKLQDEAKNG